MSTAELDLPEGGGWRRRAGLHHRLLALAVVGGAGLTLVSTGFAAGGVAAPLVVVLAPLVLWCALTPDSDLGTLVVIGLAIVWLGTVDGGARTGPWLLGAAIGLTVFHGAMAAATVAPPGARWNRAMARTWAARLGVVTGTTAVVWALAWVLDDTRPSGRGSALALVLALVATAAAAWWTRRRSLDES
jgi:hypothetical protein